MSRGALNTASGSGWIPPSRLRSFAAYFFRWVASIAVVAALTSAAGFVGLWCWYGSTSAVIASLKGNAIYTVQPSVASRPIQAGERAEVQFVVENLTRKPVTIYGAEVSCTCVATDAFPVTLGPREKRRLGFSLRTHAGQEGKVLSEQVKLFTNHRGSPVLLKLIVPVSGTDRQTGLEG